MTPVAATIALELRRAFLCLDCETVCSAQPRCPRCTSAKLFPLSTWASAIRRAANEAGPATEAG